MRDWPLAAPLRVLQDRQFAAFTAGNTLSLVGTWMQRIACAWLVWDLTGSAFWLGVLAAADLLPVVIVGPVAGVAADRWDRLRQNRLAQMVSTVLALVLAGLLAADMLPLFLLVVLVTLQGALTAAVQPARLAMVHQMVPGRDLSVAVAINAVTVNLARLVGPAVAAVMILKADIFWVFALNALMTAVFVVILGRLRLAPRTVSPLPGNFLGQMRDGFAYAFGEPAVRMILVILLLGGIVVRSLLELVPAIAAEIFADTTTGLAILTGAAAVGAITAGLTVTGGRSPRLMTHVLAWWALGAVAAVVLVRAPTSLVAVPAAMAVGASITRALVGTQTYIQLVTPDALRGRALSIHGLIARSSPAFGALAIGYAADRVGLAPSVTVASIILLVAIAGALAFMRVRGFEG